MQIQVQIDQAQWAKVEQALASIPGAMQKVAQSAVNRGLSGGRTIIKREIRKELNLSQATVLAAIHIQTTAGDQITGVILVSRKPQKLIKYGGVQTATGVRVLVRRSKGPEEIEGAFIATMKSGHRGIFRRLLGEKVVPNQGRYAERRLKRGPRKGQPLLRAPIEEIYGPTVVGVLAGKPGLLEIVTAEINATVAKRLEAGVARFIEQRHE